MDIEFHYHITYILARKTGHSETEASTIAYACQYTDDNNDKYQVILDGSAGYENFISQTLNILHPKNRLVRIYTCFHFLPGEYLTKDARRVDGALHLFNTTPDSPDAQKMFKAALDSGNLHRIGIATHCYSDTWAHQNFVGFKHAFGGIEGMLQKVVPNIGHADAEHRPDIPNLEWTDPRLLKDKATVRNRRRFLLAARSIFTAFAEQNGLDDIETRWADLAERLGRAIGDDCPDVKKCKQTQANRVAAYRSICPDIPEYDEHKWVADATAPTASLFRQLGNFLWRKASEWRWIGAFLKAYWPTWFRARTFRAKDGFRESDWFRFQEAVKAHQVYVMDLHKDRYEQIGAAVQKVL